ncbi:MAG: PD40 domain-containing protein [Thermomicrobiales bacterium]|nr:PD40 domain-containing protein [Thermomicrobiales bacterium]
MSTLVTDRPLPPATIGAARTGRTGRQWPLFLACGLALLAACLALGWDLSEPWRRARAVPTGRLILPMRGGLTVYDLVSGQERELVSNAQNANVTAASWSPDRSRLVYAYFHRPADDRVNSSELFTIPVGGGAPELLVGRDRPGTVLDTPVWAPDGRTVYFGYQGLDGRRPVVRVERASVPDGQREPLYEDASFPGVSPDGRQLAFVRDEAGGQGLWIGPSNGGEPRQVIRAGDFQALMGPRFSPDGSRLAFSTIGIGPRAGTESPLFGWLAWLSVPVAYAHGDPWDIWTVRTDGSDLRRLTVLQEDEPLVSWSPDGRWLAVLGTGGLWIVDAAGIREPVRLADGSFGAIDWAP